MLDELTLAYKDLVMEVTRKNEVEQEFRLAIKLLKKANRLIPWDFDIAYELARFQKGVSSPKKAIRIGRLLVAEWPNEAIAHYFLGNILRCNHRLGASIESYDKALKIDPSFIEALNNKGLSLNDLGMFEVAVPVLMRALALAPSDPDVILNLAHAYTMSGQFSLARRMAKRFIHRTKAEPRGYRLLANIEADAGNLYLATEIFEKSLAIYPSDIPTIRDFCVLLMELKRFPEAIDLLQRGLKVAPDNNEFAAESMELRTQMGL